MNIHRGANVVSTEGKGICTSHNSSDRSGWGPATPLEHPTNEEEEEARSKDIAA